MAIFGFGKDKKDSGATFEQVLAYLEDAQRTRTSFTLMGPRKMEVGATLQALDEGEGLITFQTQQPLVADLRANLVLVALPETLELRERRSQPRARLNPKEGTTLTALTGLFEGVGINGAVENLSETGARIRVEKAMNLKGEKRLPLGSALVPPGQSFMLIKLNKAPKCPAVMELTGRAVFLDASGGLVIGIAFDPLRPDLAGALRSLVASRTTPIPAVLPPKARRKPEALEEPVPVEAAPVEAAPVEATPAPLSQAPKADALTRLKKRSRAVVALAPTPAFGDILKDHLQEEGYGRTLVTHSQKEFMDFLLQPNLALLFIDGNLSTLDALQFVTQLRAAHPVLPPIILAVEEVSTAIALAARRNGVTHILVKPYELDAAFSDLLNQQLG